MPPVSNKKLYFVKANGEKVLAGTFGLATVVGTYIKWADPAYRKLAFSAAPTGDLLTWLEANGVKQATGIAVQPSKDVSITANGTTEVTPDVPYDVLKKVSVSTNVDSYDTETAETVTCESSACTISGLFFMSGSDGNKLIAPYTTGTSGSIGAKILKGSHITFTSSMGGFPIYWSPSDALEVVSNAIYSASGEKIEGYYVCKAVKDFSILMDD